VYDKLLEIDPEYAKELHPNNLQYVIRAIEVKTVTGKSKRDFRTEKKLKYDTLFLTPYTGDREYLYNRINLRVQMMFEE
jgi:tRNA dimethylallyltransferase